MKYFCKISKIKNRTNVTGFRDDVRLISFWDVISLGKKTANNNLVDVSAEPVPPTPGKSWQQI